MPNTPVPATAGGMPEFDRRATDRQALYAEWSGKARTLGFDLDAMSIEGLWQLSDALSRLVDTLCGLVSQPRFRSHEAENQPGTMLNNLLDDLNSVRAAISDMAQMRPALTYEDQCRKFGLLAREYVDGMSNPSAILAEIARIASNLDRSTED